MGLDSKRMQDMNRQAWARAVLTSKLQQCCGGVGPGRQHKDERGGGGGVRVARMEVKDGRLHIPVAMVSDKVKDEA